RRRAGGGQVGASGRGAGGGGRHGGARGPGGRGGVEAAGRVALPAPPAGRPRPPGGPPGRSGRPPERAPGGWGGRPRAGPRLAPLTLLAEVAEEGPLLCIVDDAQWIDHDSEQALVFAARRLHAEGVAMLFAAREGEFQPGVLPELRLRPLDDVAVREVLADRSGTAVTEDVARRVAGATGGNALAVAELASLLSPAQLAAREPLPLPLPLSTGVERLFAERVRALAPGTQQLLVVAAADDTARPEVVLGAAERLELDV